MKFVSNDYTNTNAKILMMLDLKRYESARWAHITLWNWSTR